MKIPSYFTKGISDFFYDKNISIYSFEAIKDEHGGITRSISDEATSQFNGNVRFDKLDVIKEQYGIAESIDVAITCDRDVEIGFDRLIKYDNKYYEVVKIINCDSHKLVGGKLWQHSRT